MLLEGSVVALGIVRIDPRAYFSVIKIRVGQTENIVLRLRTDREIGAYPLTFSHQIFLRDIGIEQKTITGAISRADLKGPGRPFLDVDLQIDSVRLTGFLGRDLYILKIS